jgi:hypothetical protein
MPRSNQFRHQSYPTVPEIVPTRHVLNVDPGPADFERLHCRHNVQQVVLVPGTFAGDDPFNVVGTLRTIADRLPVGSRNVHDLADRVADKMRDAFSRVADDVGNFTNDFAQRFEELVGGDPQVMLLNPIWSGQNHHFARADLAVRLINHLDSQDLFRGEQVLLWGHSHAGNGFALLSNLLANDEQAVGRFFESCGQPEAEHWQRAHRILKTGASPHPLAKHVTTVTFGTPVRYGWDTNGIHQVYHVLFDRAADDGTQITTAPLFLPHSIGDMLAARHGDWVQAFAITGTDVVPPAPGPIERNRLIAELLLQGLEPPELTFDTQLIPGKHLQHLCARWKTGTRCHTDGHNLLVDYQPCGRTMLGQPIEASVFGHGVATTIDWLPAHLDLLLKRMDLSGERRT